MRYILLNIIIFVSLFPIPLSAKISKQTALWQGEAIVEEKTMLNAGSWWLTMNYCEGTFSKNWRQELAKLSWEDFKNFNRGGREYDQGYYVEACDKNENAKIKNWYNEITNYIRSEIKRKGISTSSSNNSQSSSSSSTDYEENLKKLKSLFDQNLISQDEYDAKRKEILDAM